LFRHFFYRTKQSPSPASSPSKLSQSKIFVETSPSGDLFAFKTAATAGVIDIFCQVLTFHPFYRTQVSGVRSSGPSLSNKGFEDLTDVTLADIDINSIQTDNVNMANQGNVAMQVTLSGGQLWNPCKVAPPEDQSLS